MHCNVLLISCCVMENNNNSSEDKAGKCIERLWYRKIPNNHPAKVSLKTKVTYSLYCTNVQFNLGLQKQIREQSMQNHDIQDKSLCTYQLQEGILQGLVLRRALVEQVVRKHQVSDPQAKENH